MATRIALEDARNQKDGLAAVKATNPDLIVLDVMMDTATAGFQTALALRTEDPESEYRDYRPPDLVLNNQRLIRTRWLAGAMLLVAGPFSVRVAGLALPEIPLYLLAGFILAHNFALLRSLRHHEDDSYLRRLVRLQVVLDWLSMTVFVHLTGGVVSPELVFFFLHVTIRSACNLGTAGPSSLCQIQFSGLPSAKIVVSIGVGMPNSPRSLKSST